MATKLIDISEPVKFQINESTSLPPGVLSKVSGPFFFPGGVSRNERYYPEELWESVLKQPRVQEKLKNLVMYGTVFHPRSEPPIEEYSHVVSDLWIEADSSGKKIGMGEALILDTPRGKVLNTFLKLGSRWCVSSRASGAYIPNKKTESGAQVVDPESFQLDTFDFTPDPGFLDAHPKLVESLESPSSRNIVEDFSMSSFDNREIMNEEVFKSLLRENKNLKKDLDEALTNCRQYEDLGSPDQIKEALESGKHVAKALRDYTRQGTVSKIKAIRADRKKVRESLRRYKALGSRKAIVETLKNAEKLTSIYNKYRSIGSPKEIQEVFSRSVKLSNVASKYKKLGSPYDIHEAFIKTRGALSLLKSYKKIGTVKEIQESYKRVLEMVKLLDKYKKFGAPSEIKESYSKMADFVSNYKKKSLQSKAPFLAQEFNVSESTVLALVESIPTEKKLRKTLSRLQHSNKEARLALFESENKKAEKAPLNESAVSKIARNL